MIEGLDQRVAEAIAARHGLTGHGKWNDAIRRALRESGEMDRVTTPFGALDDAVLDKIAGSLTVPETYFMRHHAQLVRVCEHVVARLVGGATTARVLSAGCSTGEEPYSLVLCLMRELGRYAGERVDVQACDLSADAIAKARAAEYGSWSFRGVPAWLLEEHFQVLPGGRYRLSDEARSRVHFARSSVRDALVGCAEGSLDAVMFRNVGIYLSAGHLAELFTAFRRVLRADGLLVVAPSDPRPPRELFHRTDHESTSVYAPGAALPLRAQSAPARPERRKAPAVLRAVGSVPTACAPAPAPEPPSREIIRSMADDGDLEGALEFARQRVLARPTDADEHLFFGQMQLAGGRSSDREAAIESMRKAVFLAPDNAMGRFWYAHSLIAAGRMKKALGQLEALGAILDLLPADSRFSDGEIGVPELREARDFLLEGMR
jgi:chemotaxis protein methyltransferase CheR